MTTSGPDEGMVQPKPPISHSVADSAPGIPSRGTPESIKEVALLAEYSERFTSPFPPPKILEGYERAKRGLSDRVIEEISIEAAHRRKLQGEEAVHRRKLEESAQAAREGDMQAARDAERRGQYCALAICLFIVACGTIAVLFGHTIAGSVIGSGAAVLGLVNAFLSRRSTGPSRQPETSESSEQPVDR